MKYIMCQPANKRFQWEVQTAISDLMHHGISDVVVLFLKEDASVVDHIKKQFDVSVHVYDDQRHNKRYIPSIKPYLFYRYLEEVPERQAETYFYMDSDMVFRQLPDYGAMAYDQHNWFGSDCNGYMNHDYLKQCTNAEKVIGGMLDIVGIDEKQIEEINGHAIGGQYIIDQPSIEYFKKVYHDSIKLWDFVSGVSTNFQKWTVEMYATLWNMLYFGITPHAHDELAFVFPTDSMEKYETVNILHNAGVTAEHDDLFRKSDYINKSPFTCSHDYINKSKASYAYLKKLEAAGKQLNKQ